MDKENTRNTIAFVVSAVVILLLYQMFVLQPRARQEHEAARARAIAAVQQPLAASAPGAAVFATRGQAAAQSRRVPIDTPALQGSVALKGGRLDDLFLKDYRETLARNSPPVELFRPEGAKQAYFADFGFTGAAHTPTPDTVWTLASGSTLAPGKPITLTWDNGEGLVFARTIAVDARYMFTVANTVTNKTAGPLQLAPYASVQRQGMPELSHTPIIHEGAVGVFNNVLQLVPFKDWKKRGDVLANSSGGWMGVTDKYWLAAVVPEQNEAVKGDFRVDTVNGVDVYQADYVGGVRTLQPGAAFTETTRVFAGAKKVSILRGYEVALGIPHLDDAVDWGHLWFFTRPIFWLLSLFETAIGNFGLAILALTVLVKAVLFPLANKSYESISKMKKLQPELAALKARLPDDQAAQQKETMALYQREKINPVMGCLPVLVQIPVFYSLYKVLFVTLEMRHASFFGWIHDLSAPDPTSFVNLFGLIPWNPATAPGIGHVLDGPLHIGLWPIVYGFTMWLSTAMNPQPVQDPSQKIIFQLFPLIFTFALSHSPAGLVIYWSWSTTLSIVQQYVIMHRFKAENPIDNFLGRFRGRAAPAGV